MVAKTIFFDLCLDLPPPLSGLRRVSSRRGGRAGARTPRPRQRERDNNSHFHIIIHRHHVETSSVRRVSWCVTRGANLTLIYGLEALPSGVGGGGCSWWVVGVLIDTHHRLAHPQPRPRRRPTRTWEPRACGPRAVAAAPLVCHLCSASGLGLGPAPPVARSPRKCPNRAGALASQVPYPRVAHHGPRSPWGQGRV